MDWNNVRGGAGARWEPPPLQLLELCWRLRSPSGKMLECGIYLTQAPGVELRASYGEEFFVRSVRVRDNLLARAYAEDWRQIALSNGYKELET